MHILEQNAVCLMIAKSMFDNTTGRWEVQISSLLGPGNSWHGEE